MLAKREKFEGKKLYENQKQKKKNKKKMLRVSQTFV